MKKAKFNFFDVLIILAVAAVCFGGYKYFNKKSSAGAKAPEVSYVVELKRKDASYADQVRNGDDVYDAIKGGYYGKVTDFKKEKCTEIVTNAKLGTFDEAEVENRYNYYITVTGTPTTYSDSDIMFASQDIKVGNKIYIRSKNYSGEGTVVDIDVAK